MSSFDASRHAHLWNELSPAERRHLHPHLIENHILHLQQCRSLAVKAHRRHMEELDAWIANLRRALAEEASDAE
jgi:hypothetical protein